MQTIADIMTSNLLTVLPDTTLRKAAALMAEHRISCLLAESEGRAIGILTERDLVHAASQGVDMGCVSIHDHLQQPVITVCQDLNIYEAFDFLSEHRVRHLVVTDDDEKLIGLVTFTDLAKATEVEDYLIAKPVSQVMKRSVSTLSSNASLRQAVDIMERNGFSCVVIVEHGLPLGIITERDITRMVCHDEWEMDAPLHLVMSSPVTTVFADTMMLDAADIMRKNGYRRMVVVDEGKQLAGLVTQYDLLGGLEGNFIRNLRQSLKRERKTFEHIIGDLPIVKYVLAAEDDGFMLVQISANVETHLGYSETECLRDAWWFNRVHQADRASVAAFFDKIEAETQRQKYVLDYRMIKGDGTTIWIHDAVSVVRAADGRVIEVIGTWLDITERRYLDEKLHRMSQAVEQAGESVIITDKKGVIEYANPAFCRITGYTLDEAIGNTPRLLKSGNQERSFYAGMWKTITAGNIWQGKVVDKRKDGTFFTALLTITPIKNDLGEITHYTGLHADVTERETEEAHFRHTQKMAAIGTMVGGIAHNFNNMLAGVTGNIYLAKQRARSGDNVMANLNNVEVLSHQAAEMIQQLLSFARKGVVQMKAMPLAPFLAETLKLLVVAVPEDIEVNHAICGDDLLINGDATLLHQMLANLINNARDAVHGVDNPAITIKLEAMCADERFGRRHPDAKHEYYAHLSVADNGTGIAERNIEHLFEPFFTTKEEGKGTGLGLSMLHGAMKTHHGFVDVTSKEGEGATFHLYFPQLKTTQKAEQSEEVIVETAGNGELILLADDADMVRETTAEVLESLGYRVLQAKDGIEGMELFQQYSQEIAIALLDMVMPHCDGLTLGKKIRAMAPNLPLFFLTGYDAEHVFNGENPLSNSEVMTKPVGFDLLSNMIRQYLVCS
ncbi:MAG: CBS domain-containing protein [Mariprofundales bacterium]